MNTVILYIKHGEKNKEIKLYIYFFFILFFFIKVKLYSVSLYQNKNFSEIKQEYLTRFQIHSNLHLTGMS